MTLAQRNDLTRIPGVERRGAIGGSSIPSVGGAGRRCLPAHVTLATARRQPRFAAERLAAEVFARVRRDPRTLAAVLMPDHLHWLLSDGLELAEVLGRFKRETQQHAAALGHTGRLWQRGFFATEVESPGMVRVSAAYLLVNPVAAGLAATWQEYPWAVLDPRLGD